MSDVYIQLCQNRLISVERKQIIQFNSVCATRLINQLLQLLFELAATRKSVKHLPGISYYPDPENNASLDQLSDWEKNDMKRASCTELCDQMPPGLR